MNDSGFVTAILVITYYYCCEKYSHGVPSQSTIKIYHQNHNHDPQSHLPRHRHLIRTRTTIPFPVRAEWCSWSGVVLLVKWSHQIRGVAPKGWSGGTIGAMSMSMSMLMSMSMSMSNGNNCHSEKDHGPRQMKRSKWVCQDRRGSGGVN